MKTVHSPWIIYKILNEYLMGRIAQHLWLRFSQLHPAVSCGLKLSWNSPVRLDLITFRSANREVIVIQLWVENWEVQGWEKRDGWCTAVDIPNRAIGELKIEHVLFSCGGGGPTLLCVIEAYHCVEHRPMPYQSLFSWIWSCNKIKPRGNCKTTSSTPILQLIAGYKCQ